jgi:glycerophosphoryl diester phosphodiesterase
MIAHRGASGSAPEHTAAARLAIEQHVDFVEQISASPATTS